MKITHLLLAASMIISQIHPFTIHARDGKDGDGGGHDKGGGGQGNGGGGRHEQAPSGNREVVQRSPSMSRAIPQQSSREQFNRPTVLSPQRIERPQITQPQTVSPQVINRPQIVNPSQVINQPQVINRSSPDRFGGNSRGQDQVRQFLREHPVTIPRNRPIDTQVQQPNAPINRQNSQFGRPNERQTQQSIRPIQEVVKDSQGRNRFRDQSRYKDTGSRLRGDLTLRHPNHHQWFNNNFWDRHRYRPPYYAQMNNWWNYATVGSLGAWLGWQGQPYYYGNYDDYGYNDNYWGPSYDSTYDSTYVPQIYNQQSEPIVDVGDQATSGEWMPLGVFALSQINQPVDYSNMFVQLAINKEGVIAGTFYNSTTDLIYEVAGFVDPETQRAVWKITDYPDVPVIESGVYNLTEDEVPVRLYFSYGKVSDMLLVRIQDQ